MVAIGRRECIQRGCPLCGQEKPQPTGARKRRSWGHDSVDVCCNPLYRCSESAGGYAELVSSRGRTGKVRSVQYALEFGCQYYVCHFLEGRRHPGCNPERSCCDLVCLTGLRKPGDWESDRRSFPRCACRCKSIS